MKYPLLRLIAFVVLGMVAGGVFVAVNIGGQIDRLIQENQLLDQQLELCSDELNREKKSRGEVKKKVVTSIEPHVTIIGEHMPGLEERNSILALDKQVRELLAPVKGQEVEKLNYLLVPQIIDGRTIELEGFKYHLKVTLMAIDTNIIVYLEAKKEKIIQPVIEPGVL